MSIKGRGAPVADAEFYPTPGWATRRILEAMPHVVTDSAGWLEPCAGDGAITAELVRAGVYAGKIAGSDIRDVPRPESIAGGWFPGESFDQWDTRIDVVITNPPFSLAPALIDHFLPRCDWLILLLRAAFRLAPWRNNMPDEYKLPQRPEFLASYKCKNKNQQGITIDGCGWTAKVPLAVFLDRCPDCGSPHLQRSTSDSSEYSWFVWTPERGRSAGLTRVLPDTPLSERREGR